MTDVAESQSINPRQVGPSCRPRDAVRILLVEDERVQSYFFKMKCTRMFGKGVKVECESDGVGAFNRLKRGEAFDIIVSDVYMNVMDGVSLYTWVFG